MARYAHPLSIRPGQKAHPLQLHDNEWYDERDRERMARRTERFANMRARSQQKADEKRARRYQLEDETRARRYQTEDADLAFQRQRVLTGDEYGYRGELQAQDNQADLQRAAQAFGFGRQLAHDEFGYDTLGRQQAADIAAEAALQGFNFNRDLQGDRIGAEYGLAELGIAADEQGDYRRHDLGMEKFSAGVDANRDRDFLLHALGLEAGDAAAARELEIAETQHMWNVKDEMRRRGWAVYDREVTREEALEYLDKEWGFRNAAAQQAHVWAERGVLIDQQFEMGHVGMLRTQEQIRRGLKRLPHDLKSERDKLQMEWGAILASSMLHEEQRNKLLLKNRMDMMNIYRGAEDVPLEEQQAALAELWKTGTIKSDNGNTLQYDPEKRKFEGIRNDDPPQQSLVHGPTGYAQDKLTDAKKELYSDFAKRLAEARANVGVKDNMGNPVPGTFPTTDAAISAVKEEFGPWAELLGINLNGPLPLDEVYGSMAMANKLGISPEVQQVPEELVPEFARDDDPFSRNYKMGMARIPQMTAEQAEEEYAAGRLPDRVYRNEEGVVKRVALPEKSSGWQGWDASRGRNPFTK